MRASFKLLVGVMTMLVTTSAFAMNSEKTVEINVSSGELAGTLLTPEGSDTVALIIAGSGPTDRNGNNPSMMNNSLKMLAEALADQGISSLRYDKRGIGASADAGLSEEELRFEHYIDDAKKWVTFLNEQEQFKNIAIIGHSEGSLIGMVAAQSPKVDSFISIAGAGRAIDEVLLEQLKSQPPVVVDQATKILDALRSGETIDEVPEYLNSIFRPSVQPYMISWLQYDPQTEIAKLEKPVLIVQGTTDIQVGVDQAELFVEANSEANLAVIEGMNHILKDAPTERTANIQTYTDPNLPLHAELADKVTGFLHDLD